MAQEDDIVQRIRFEGEEDVMATFARIGQAGSKAFQNIRTSFSNTGAAFQQVVNQSRVAFQAIESGSATADAELKKLDQDAVKLGQSFTAAARSISGAFSTIGNAFKTGALAQGMQAVRNDVGRLVASFTAAKDRIVNTAQSISAAFAKTTLGTKLQQNFGSLTAAANTFGRSLRNIGSGLGTFTRRLSAIGLGAGVAITAFKALTSAVTGTAAAQRVASREALADIRDEKGDRMGLFNIQQQSIAQQKEIQRNFASGKMTLEDYTEALEGLEQQTADNVKAFFAQDAAEEQARKRQFQAMKRLREQEAFDAVADKVGNQAAGAFMRLGNVVEQVSNRMKQILGPTIANIVNGIATAIQQAQPQIIAFFEDIKKILEPVSKDIGQAFKDAIPQILEFLKGAVVGVQLLVGALQGLMTILNGIASIINAVFGTKLTGAMLAGVVAVAALTGAFSLLMPVVTAVGAAIAFLAGLIGGVPLAIIAIVAAITLWVVGFDNLKKAWDGLVVAFQVGWAVIKGFFTGGIDGAIKEFDKLAPETKKKFQEMLKGIKDVLMALPNYIASVIQDIQNAWNEFKNFMNGIWNDIVQAAKDAWAQIPAPLRSLLEGAGSIVGIGTSGQPVGLAGGGKVSGPGTSKSDSILARLSRGEFVQRAKAVRHYGTGFMNAINRLQFPKVPGFAMGGLVPGRQPLLTLADGITGAPKNVLNLSLDGEAFDGLLAGDDTFTRLKKHAIKRSLSPRKPNWYR